jgi:hypothetical protein
MHILGGCQRNESLPLVIAGGGLLNHSRVGFYPRTARRTRKIRARIGPSGATIRCASEAREDAPGSTISETGPAGRGSPIYFASGASAEPDAASWRAIALRTVLAGLPAFRAISTNLAPSRRCAAQTAASSGPTTDRVIGFAYGAGSPEHGRGRLWWARHDRPQRQRRNSSKTWPICAGRGLIVGSRARSRRGSRSAPRRS